MNEAEREAAAKRRDAGRVLYMLADMGSTEMVERSESVRLNPDGLDPIWLEPSTRRERFARALDGRLQPGPYLRWLAIIRLVCERWPANFEGSAVTWRTKSEPPSDKLPLTARLRELLRSVVPPEYASDLTGKDGRELEDWFNNALFVDRNNSNVWRDADDYLDKARPLYQALEIVWNQIRMGDGADPSTLEALQSVSLCGPEGGTFGEALERLDRWLVSDEPPVSDSLQRLPAHHFVFKPRSERGRQLDWVRQALTNTDEAHPPLVNIWSPNDWSGLTAFVTEIICQVRKEVSVPTSEDKHFGIGRRMRGHRPQLVYLSAHLEKSTRGLSTDAEQDAEDPGEQRRVTPALLLASLRTALGLSPVAIAGFGHDAVSDPMKDIRRILTKRHVILVIDGVRRSAPPFAHVWNAVRNTEWDSILHGLVQPCIDSLRETGGVYRSRILVTSNQEITDLAPWTAKAGEVRLPSLDLEGAEELLEETQEKTSLQKLQERLEDLWPSKASRPYPAPDLARLRQLYLPNGVTPAEFMYPGGASGTTNKALPDELEMTLRRIHLRVPSGNGPRPDSRTLVGKFLATVDHGNVKMALSAKSCTLVLQLLAVSVSGLRVQTLRRIGSNLMAAMEPKRRKGSTLPAAADFAAMLKDPKWAARFGQHYASFVEAYVEDEQLAAPEGLAPFELEDALKRRVPEKDAGPNFLDIRLDGMRELIVADLISTDDGTLLFKCMNEVLAQEALGQAATESRHAEAAFPPTDIGLRRYVQAAYHGLLSIDTDRLHDAADHDDLPEPGEPASALALLPTGAYRRFVYLYQFIYRQQLERPPLWHLARGLGRNQLRLELLSLFANPGWGRRVLGLLPAKNEGERDLVHFGALSTEPVSGFGRALQPTAGHLRGIVGADLFLAILHACIRTGQHREFASAADVLGRQASLGMTSASLSLSTQRDFAKVRIDALQAKNDSMKSHACLRRELRQLNASDLLETLIALGPNLQAKEWDRSEFEAQFVPVLTRLVDRPVDDLEHMSDILFRLGESVAAQADWMDDPRYLDDSLVRYADAYAIFWLADRVRAHSATLDLSRASWPSISARAMRYFVRVCFKLGKLIALIGKRQGATASDPLATRALSFYRQGRSRSDVFARHMAPLSLERVYGTLLLAAASRTESEMVTSLQLHANESETVAKSLLDTSMLYVEQAWAQMQRVYPYKPLTRRFVFERYKTLKKMAGAEHREHSAELAQRDHATLKLLCEGSDFWEEILRRLRGKSDTKN